jgi:hypothetical protein
MTHHLLGEHKSNMAGLAIAEEERNLLNEIIAMKVKNAYLTKKKRSVHT